MGKLWIGTSGWVYKDWRGLFYPKGVAQRDWLTYFAQHFNTVEVNATFYRPFPSSVLARWREITPPEFAFTLKGPRPITHLKRLESVDDELRQFVESSEGLGEKLSAMLWQFPPSFKVGVDDSLERLTAFLPKLPRTIHQVVEFRHKSWFRDDVYALLNAHNVGFCINDSSRWAAAEVVTGDVMYIRFHGPTKLYASLYSPEQLAAWADKIRPNLAERDVYIYFNNDYGGRAIQNAREIRDMLA